MQAAVDHKRNNAIRDGSRVFDAVCIGFCLLVCVATLYPMYYVFIMSVSDPKEVSAMTVFLYPKGFQLKSYGILFSQS